MEGKVKATTSRIEERLSSDLVRKWYMSKNGQTKAVYLRNLYSFLDTMEITPEQLISMKNREEDHPEIHQLLMQFIAKELGAGKSSKSYIYKRVETVKSFLKANGIKNMDKIEVKGHKVPRSLSEEEVPDIDKVRKIIHGDGPLRDRLCAVFEAYSGIRYEVLGMADGKRGLEVRDIPWMKVENKTVTFERVPLLIHVRDDLDKSERGYHTFLPSNGAILLKEHIEARMRNGETIGPRTPIRGPNHVVTKSVRAGVTKLFREHGIGPVTRPHNKKGDDDRGYEMVARPYVLRRFFITQIRDHLNETTREYVGGHSPTQSNDYVVGKGKIDKRLEEMWREFESLEEHLQGKAVIPSRQGIGDEVKHLNEELARIREDNLTMKRELEEQKNLTQDFLVNLSNQLNHLHDTDPDEWRRKTLYVKWIKMKEVDESMEDFETFYQDFLQDEKRIKDKVASK
jgi:hypothetical protein